MAICVNSVNGGTVILILFQEGAKESEVIFSNTFYGTGEAPSV